MILIFDRFGARKDGHFSFQAEYLKGQIEQFEPEVITSERHLIEHLRNRHQASSLAGQDSTIVVIPTARSRDLKIAIALISSTDVTVLVRVLEETVIHQLHQEELAILKTAISTSKIILTTETDELKDYIEKRLALPVERAWLIPMRKIPAMKLGPKLEITVSLIGAPRAEKGFMRVKGIRKYLKEIFKGSDTIIIIEYTNNSWRSVFLRIAGRIKRALGETVILMPLPLAESVDAYEKRFFVSDVILLPYSNRMYRNRGSGVLIEAVYAERPFVATNTIGLKNLREFGNAVEASTDREFANAVKHILDNYEDFKIGCGAARKHLDGAVTDANRWLFRAVKPFANSSFGQTK